MNSHCAAFLSVLSLLLDIIADDEPENWFHRGAKFVGTSAGEVFSFTQLGRHGCHDVTMSANCSRLGVNHYRYNHYQWPSLPYDTHYQWQSLPDDNHYHWQPLPATTTRFYWTRKPLPATTTTWQQLPYDDHWVCIFANFSNKSFKSKTTCIRIYLLVDTWRFIRDGPV